MNLYPIKFEPIIKEKIWGGHKLTDMLHKNFGQLPNGGESWEISAVPGDESVVANGPLKGLSLDRLVKQYGTELMGKSVIEQFGETFPLLVKFIDANADLSVQVHPDDTLAKTRHNSFGKSEMWYIMQADKGGRIISGFKEELTRNDYNQRVKENRLIETLAVHEVQSGDVYYIPSGRVHAIGAGVLVAEIQQTSDITYRIYDYDRKDANGNLRELHTELAQDANDYSIPETYKTDYEIEPNRASKLVHTPFFKTDIIALNGSLDRDYSALDSFVIFVCVAGDATVNYQNGNQIALQMGESLLVPADLKHITLQSEAAKLLEVYL